jgi:flagellar biosynthesis protein FlhF
LYETYRRLVENAVAEEIAQQLVERGRRELSAAQLGDPHAVRAHLAGVIESMLPTAGPIRVPPAGRPKLIALIGPTGVGKTTTIAKLAANFCLRERRRVGLITIDTFRIAAVEQLRTYAQIIDVPLQVVMTPAELRDAVQRSGDRDIVFIDTAGRSQRDSVKTAELRTYFEAVRPDEVHLVLSSTCSEAVLTQTIHKFREVGVDRIIFTKLDEAIGFGVMLSCLQKAQAQLSYVTTGQDVPDDIRVGDGKAIARLIVGEGSRKPAADRPQSFAECPESERIATAPRASGRPAARAAEGG